MKTPTKLLIQFPQKVLDLDWKLILFLLIPLSLLLFVSFTSISSATTVRLVLTSFSSFTPFKSIFLGNNTPHVSREEEVLYRPLPVTNESENDPPKSPVDGRIAVCLVGGARRFELTGPSIIENILKVYPNSDLFLHCPMDSNAYKLSLLKDAPKVTAVKIFQPETVPETAVDLRVLTSRNSPNGIQGLLQYFNLVEGCLNMIYDQQQNNNFTYDWIIRTRVDGYWSDPLGPENFVPSHYVVPSGSSYGGLNDRLGIGDLNSSIVALSRFSLLPVLDSAGIRQTNSERSFKAQLTTHNVEYIETRLPFCVLSDRQYPFPPGFRGVPVASISSPGPLSGTKCRPCKPACKGICVDRIMDKMDKGWSWTEHSNNTLHLCDAHDPWEEGWEKIFDRVAGKKLAGYRTRIRGMKLQDCFVDFEKMRNLTVFWDAPPVEEICRLGLVSA